MPTLNFVRIMLRTGYLEAAVKHFWNNFDEMIWTWMMFSFLISPENETLTLFDLMLMGNLSLSALTS
jgi:hypothetical protein